MMSFPLAAWSFSGASAVALLATLGLLSAAPAGAQTINRIEAFAEELRVHVADAASTPCRVVALPMEGRLSPDAGWSAEGTGSEVNAARPGAAEFRFFTPPSGPFDPQWVSPEPMTADYATSFAMRVKIEGMAEPEMPARLFFFGSPDGVGYKDITIPATGQWEIVRADLGTDVPTEAQWEDQRLLRLDLANDNAPVKYASATVEIDWIAVTNDPEFSGGLYTSYDEFWDFGYPEEAWPVSPEGIATIPRFDDGRDRLFRQFLLLDESFAPLDGPAYATEFDDTAYLASSAQGWTSGGTGIEDLRAQGGDLTADFTVEAPFDPQISNSQRVEAAQYRTLAARARVVGYTGLNPSESFAVYTASESSPDTGRASTRLATDGEWHVLNVDMTQQLPLPWEGQRRLRIDFPDGAGGQANVFANAELQFDWIALVDAPSYSEDAPPTEGQVWDFVDNRKFPLPEILSKKGVDGTWVEDQLELGSKVSKLNGLMRNLINLNPNPAMSITIDGIEVGINPNYVNTLTNAVRERTAAGQVIYFTLLNGIPEEPEPGNPLLFRDSAFGEAPNNLGGFNVNDPLGVIYFRAALEFLAQRFSDPSGSNGYIQYFIIGNEVDQHWAWHNLGEMDAEAVMDHYAREMRIADLALRKYHPQLVPLASFTKRFNRPVQNPKQEMLGRVLLEGLNDRFLPGGDFPWGVAWHPYPSSLFDPRFWNDTTHTLSFDAIEIGYRNVEVIAQWLRQYRYLYKGQPRHLGLTEQGFHTLNRPDGQEIQAAAYAYSWHRISQIDGIHSYIYHRHVDHRDEQGLLPGLWTRVDDPDQPSTPDEKKMIWETFQAADSPAQEGAFAFALPIVGLDSWEDGDPAAGQICFHFDDDGDPEGWSPAANLEDVATSTGLLMGTVTSPDPQLVHTNCFFITDRHESILIRMAVDHPGNGQLFWGTAQSNAFAAAREKAFPLKPTGDLEFYLVDMREEDEWIGQQIRRLRLDPTNAGQGTFAIDYIIGGMAEDFDQDGLSDSEEGLADIDGDGLPNLADNDSDGDGVSDQDEVREGTDPYRPNNGAGFDEWMMF